MKLKFISLLAIVASSLSYGCSSSNKEATDENKELKEEERAVVNTLTSAEKKEGWKLLFNGESTQNWRGFKSNEFLSAWNIDDKAIHLPDKEKIGSKKRGDIIYNKKFSDFHLKLDWKIAKGGNSGIFYLGQESDKYKLLYETAPEMQILDNENHPDAKRGKNGNRQAGSLYDLYPADPQNAKPAGEWNTAEIIVSNGTVVHKQNGETVLEYQLWTPQWEKDVAASKFIRVRKEWADVAKEGYIGLQDHGDAVWYRNIKVKEL